MSFGRRDATLVGGSSGGGSSTYSTQGDATGDVNTNSTSFASVNGIGTIAIPAATGDTLELEFIAELYLGTAPDKVLFKFVVGGTAQIQREMWIQSTSDNHYTVFRQRVPVTAGMISGGTVTVDIHWAKNSNQAFMANNGSKLLATLAGRNLGPLS